MPGKKLGRRMESWGGGARRTVRPQGRKAAGRAFPMASIQVALVPALFAWNAPKPVTGTHMRRVEATRY